MSEKEGTRGSILEALHDFLFELAGTDRLSILLKLRKEPVRLSHLSKELNSTVQETARNLTRLADAKLIVKDAEGSFRLTPYGEEALNLLEGFEFLLRHREYFVNHTLSPLPKEFSYSLASLGGCQLVNDVMVGFSDVEKMIEKAEEYIWILSNQILVSTLPKLEEKLKLGVEFRVILPVTVAPPRDALERMQSPVYLEAFKVGKFGSKYLKKVDVMICLSEKELAVLSFPNIEGKLDYLGFRGTDEASLNWSKNLFLHYWNIASRRPPDFMLPMNTGE